MHRLFRLVAAHLLCVGRWRIPGHDRATFFLRRSRIGWGISLALVMAFGSAMGPAFAQTRCIAFAGDYRIAPGEVPGLAFIHMREPFTSSPTEKDGAVGIPNECGSKTMATVRAGGPFPYVYPTGDVYESVYYERHFTTPFFDTVLKRCASFSYIEKFSRWGVDGHGLNDLGAGTACASRVKGPDIALDPARLMVRPGKFAMFRVRIQANGEPIQQKEISGTLVQGDRTEDVACFKTNHEGVGFCELGWKLKKSGVVTVTCDNCNAPAQAQVEVKRGVVLGFFNGVWNTEEDATSGLKALKEVAKAPDADTELKYENFYNQTGKGSSSTMLQDIAETFAQRQAELDGVLENRWEHYWDLLAGRHGDPRSLTGSLISGIGTGALALGKLLDATFNATLGQIVGGWARLLADPPTQADMSAHIDKLVGLHEEGFEFVFVAHSQGNLFANAAFDGLARRAATARIRAVHIAPASPTVRGDYGLSGMDFVINGLRIQGITSVQPANWNIPFSTIDASGHALVPTYLDAAREGRAKVEAHIKTALAPYVE